MPLPRGTGEKLATAGSAFTTGVGMSFVVKKWPAAGIIGSILAAGAGIVTSLLATGWPAEVAEGVGSGGAAILGSTIAWLPDAATAGKDGLHTQLQKGDQRIDLRLKSGAVGATAEAAAIAARAGSKLEF